MWDLIVPVPDHSLSFYFVAHLIWRTFPAFQFLESHRSFVKSNCLYILLTSVEYIFMTKFKLLVFR